MFNRIGRFKRKRGCTYTHKIHEPKNAKDKVDKFLRMLDPLKEEGIDLKYDHEYNIDITQGERKNIMKEIYQQPMLKHKKRNYLYYF